ncbi:ADP-ribosyl-(dinitrogen reductase) hydrolase [Brevundimonas naejangsanensis]|uniref:protein-tyrosine-phosphatase n=1 Tax=Brevundimonas naejangsanensis TaxID=588932 RepID=A0A494RL58_9CAUL|nr:ADP-ribosylglycohydrolase family protein [Brevundimonas naejangsanensis]AYG95653.1 ADP-ribosyl-(dinitrogen reductase) hydrolase [Brevundimonas naejangsanensis]
MARTSQSDPIVFNEVRCGAGVLGLTFCPGKSGPSVFGADWSRDLDVDLDAAVAWGASTVLTLVKPHELEMLQAPGLGAAVEARGMMWLHAPIEDLGVPDQKFEQRWCVIGHRVRMALDSGEKVVVHCRGGRGRAGMIAARLLVEMGEAPDDAIARVRAAREGAIETAEQERHVRECWATTCNREHVDRVLGCLFGGAVGDGFGYAIEFDRLPAIRKRYGEKGLTEPVLTNERLVVSDDTQMTVFTASAVARVGEFEAAEAVAAIRAAYLDWYRTQTRSGPSKVDAGVLRHRELWARRAPGNTCISALAAGGSGEPSRPVNDSKGCGGVMRVAPIGLRRDWTEGQVFELAARAAAITHGHPTGYLSAAAAAVMVRVMVDGRGLREALGVVARYLAANEDAQETMKAVIGVFEEPARDMLMVDVEEGRLGEGWVGEEALAIALYSVAASDDFRAVMRIAANHDGDSDSTASIAGQLFGARHGLSRIPWSWVSRLDVFDALCEVAGDVLAADRSDLLQRPVASAIN